MPYRNYPKPTHYGTSESRSGKCADTNNGHSQSAKREKKLKLVEARTRLAAIAQKMLMEKLNVGTFPEVLREVRKRRIAQPFVKKSRENYHEAISIALALNYVAQSKDDPIEALKQLLADEYRVRKSTNAAQIAVRVVIDYGNTDAERGANRRPASRDAAAVNHLADRGVLPDEVVALGKKIGEGLEAWGRAKPRPSTEKKHAGGPTPETSRNPRNTGNGAANAKVPRIAHDATQIAIDLRRKDPLFFRRNACAGAADKTRTCRPGDPANVRSQTARRRPHDLRCQTVAQEGAHRKTAQTLGSGFSPSRRSIRRTAVDF